MRNFLYVVTRAVTVCIIFGFTTFQASAQELSPPRLEIESTNVDNLPEVTVLVQGENLPSPLNELPITIRENGVEKEVLSQSAFEKGLQIAFAIDPTLNLAASGATGDAMQFEIANGASSLIQSGILSVRTDWITAFAVSNESKEFSQVTEWSRDHQAVVNQLYQYQPTDAAVQIGLIDALTQIINEMERSSIPDETIRTIVLFSDGSSLLDNTGINEVILSAQERNISIQIALLGEGNTQTRRQLLSVATATHGNAISYDGPSALNPIWQKLDDSSVFQQITYRLGTATSEQIAVAVPDGNGELIVATEDFPDFTLEPVQIVITSPFNGESIKRSSDNLNADLEQLNPQALPVVLEFMWPDGIQRDISSIEYTLDNTVFVDDETPLTSYDLPIIAIPMGSYPLSVVAVDEFGLSGEQSVLVLE